ncbi:tripartite tricarboxylate transporter substrate binding protein [Roseomonas sp. GC11]|uniref:Bug family tripartite tricarboxylate transporter substrate binding protein n=1 Tax=Roseomonas sp. GC11 TaxID=2950546 RepID=UPI00210A1747|nr:tripartite tricarboxylate transporter substrate binding protein [Roseomonas sp. GC11]MCQ4160315.1 tripartite tricarboxylate transporter substrate binding protein [Roseomonas sp. GC11]
MTRLNRRHLLALGAAAPLCGVARARAEDFPTRTVTWVVPYAAGGFGDGVARLLAQKMAESLKVPVVVDNRPGAGGQIAATYLRQQPADGHTLFYGDVGPLAINPTAYRKLSYDVVRDFLPVTRLFMTPSILVVAAQGPIRDFAGLVAAAKQGQGLSFGSYGTGSSPHLWGEMLRRKTGAELVHVPYRGAAPALQDLMTGRLDFMPDVAPNSLPFVLDGKLRALAVIGAHRLPQVPDVPTVSELGAPDLLMEGWNGAVIRAGTPEPVLQRLHAEITAALRHPEVTGRYIPMGLEPAPLQPAAFAAYIAQQTARWGEIIQSTGIALD